MKATVQNEASDLRVDEGRGPNRFPAVFSRQPFEIRIFSEDNSQGLTGASSRSSPSRSTAASSHADFSETKNPIAAS